MLREDPDYKPAQVMLKNILKVDRTKLAANELYKEGKYAEVRELKTIRLCQVHAQYARCHSTGHQLCLYAS